MEPAGPEAVSSLVAKRLTSQQAGPATSPFRARQAGRGYLRVFFSTEECMHSAAYCRRQAEILATQARNPHVPADRRAALEHLSRSWAICADASAFVERHGFYRPARKPRDGNRGRF